VRTGILWQHGGGGHDKNRQSPTVKMELHFSLNTGKTSLLAES